MARFKAGDKVRVTHATDDFSPADNTWVGEMDSCIGHEFLVLRHDADDGVILETKGHSGCDGFNWTFPEKALEKMIDAKEITEHTIFKYNGRDYGTRELAEMAKRRHQLQAAIPGLTLVMAEEIIAKREQLIKVLGEM